MKKSINDFTTLNNGVKMPCFGLGVYKTKDGAEVYNAIQTAFEAGYRGIDTAALYYNEEGVGKAIRESGLQREEIFVTTKVWNSDQGYESTLEAFEKSKKKLGLDYVDLYLIHWPVKEKYKDTYHAMEKLYKEGFIRAIGVSNFNIHHIEDLMTEAEIVPAVNQVEYHPWLTQEDLHKYCIGKNIQLEAWSPLARGAILNEKTLVSLGKKYSKSPAQIILRWDLQKNVIPIPKSVHKERILENADIFDFELTLEDMAGIDRMNINKRTGRDPDNFHFDF